jgi:anti-sigma-K factor RskA
VKTSNRELLDRLAAEYVLGTLRGRARRRFERWLLSPQVGALVTAWEGRLAGLEPPLERVTPPATVWRGIEARLELTKLKRAPAMRWLAIAASVLFFMGIGYFGLRNQTAVIETPQLVATQKAFIEENPETIYWRVELLGNNEQLAVHVHKAHALDAGKSLELWVLPVTGTPVSLGVLPLAGEQHLVLSEKQRAAFNGATKLAVTLEPAGGSPNGLPTGPVVHVAPLAPA